MKVLTWNIRHGGSKQHLQTISATLIQHAPDMMVLTEFRDNEKGRVIQQTLDDAGWNRQVTSNPPPKTNGILIALKETYSVQHTCPVAIPSHRWIELEVRGLRILAVHIPIDSKESKTLFWNGIIERSQKLRNTHCLIIGDLNTGLAVDAKGAPFTCVEHMQSLFDNGWHDAWRLCNGQRQEYSWFSNAKNGFRIDHAIVSDPIKGAVLTCYYSHTERENGYSDHSSLSIDLNM
jgi:exodeoxyribonuclease-3